MYPLVADHLGQQLMEHVREEYGAAMRRSPTLAVPDEICTVTDKDGRIRHEFTANGPNQRWLTQTAGHNFAAGSSCLPSPTIV